MPIIIALRNPHLKQRHWNQLRSIIGRGVMDDEKLTMGLLLEIDVITIFALTDFKPNIFRKNPQIFYNSLIFVGR